MLAAFSGGYLLFSALPIYYQLPRRGETSRVAHSKVVSRGRQTALRYRSPRHRLGDKSSPQTRSWTSAEARKKSSPRRHEPSLSRPKHVCEQPSLPSHHVDRRSRWYTITSYVNFHTSNNASLEPYWPGGVTKDSVSLNNNGNLTKAQWQLYPVSQPANGSYLLRPRVDPDGWLGTWTQTFNDPTCAAEGVDCTRLANLWPNFAGNGVWTFTSDETTGSYFLTDAQDGGSSYLDLYPNQAYLRMNNNQTAHPSDTQRWQIIPTAKINDPVFQSVRWAFLEATRKGC